MLLAALERALAEAGIDRRGEGRVLIACSGGVDSVCLAHAASTLLGARRVVLGHVDHRVRPGSGEDASLVRALGDALGSEVSCSVLEPGPDDEARLRRARYLALEEARQRCSAALVLTAHTRDDQAETVLLGLVRRTRLAGLIGIAPRRGTVVRPWLGVPRGAILAYAARHRLAWREDPTNPEPRYLRNRIRKELLPLLERRYRPGITARLGRLAEEARARDDRAPAAVARAALNSAPPRRVEVWVERTSIRVERRPWVDAPLPDGKRGAVFDAALLAMPVIRPVRSGDRIQPFGMEGHRKLQDVLVDAKVPRDARTWVWVVAGEGAEVHWVPGIVRSAAAPVGSQTREVWIFSQDAAATCDEAPEGSV